MLPGIGIELFGVVNNAPMGTRIEAVIFDGDPKTAALPNALPAVPMPGGLTMLPVTSEMLSGLDPDAIGDQRIRGSWNLKQPVAALAKALSRDRRVLYLFSETWAGPGIKECIAWRAGQLLYGPSATCDIEADLEPGYHLAPGDDAVNAGLRAIGVHATDGRDEYATVGLDKHRMTEQWLA
jgi:hypothetical protein